MKRGWRTFRRYFNTVRHLRWEQWVYRPIRRAQQVLGSTVSAEGRSERSDRAEVLAPEVREWGPWDSREAMASAERVLRGEFRFLSRTETVGEVDWAHRRVSHLWSYNLHYFGYALDLAWAFRATGDRRYRDRFVELAVDWIEANPVGRGDGWEPYPVSLRVVNWIYALLVFGDAIESGTRAELETSLATQTAFLSRRLELHILANHLQKNLKALVVAGLYFSGPSAERWLRRGLRLLWRELFGQVLPDGGHYERSPMYHAIALADLLETLALFDAAGEPVPADARDRVRRMADALGVLSRSDGRLHLFNDAAHGIAPDRSWLDRLSGRVLGQGVPAPDGPLSLPDSGYYGLADRAAGERFLIDCGAPGPSYQPGHAHCDMLSFELDLEGAPVVVDAGVCGYAGDPLREYVRSTRAHNTVAIAGGEQSDVWAAFRMGRRAAVHGADQRCDGRGYRFEGSCSPFHDPEAVHRRVVRRGERGWTVTDRVEGRPDARVASFLHLHPELVVEPDGDAFLARSARVSVRIAPFGVEQVEVRRGEANPAQGWHCPEFGVALPAPVLEMTLDRNDGRDFGYTISTAGSHAE